MRIGSLFSGAGGLDLAALELFPDASVAWHCEIEPAASKVLARHWPDVPNLGDVSLIDWAAIERTDVLTAGFPCQDVSLAGRRAGLNDGTRSGLWSHVATAIDVLRPRYVLLENVRGLLSANAIRGVESGPGGMGYLGGRSVLRALGAVLGDLADLGFDADWTCLAASKVGAAHRRERVFVLAYPANADRNPVRQQPEPEPESGRPTIARRDRQDLADTHHAGSQGAQSTRRPHMLAGGGSEILTLLPTPAVADGTGGHKTRSGSRSDELLLPGAVIRWGEYADAIRRQESLSRPAPSPTEDAPRGGVRLSAAFAEWMMLWPEGWVTDPAIGLSRAEQLRVIGNGVVPPQATAAFRDLLDLAGREVCRPATDVRPLKRELSDGA